MSLRFRKFEDWDMERVRMMHEDAGLDPRCLPNLMITTPKGDEVSNPLFVIKEICETDGIVSMACFGKITAELYFFIDHAVGTPEERWEALVEFKEHIKREGWKHGLEQLTAYIPTEIEGSFGKRLLDLGFVRSPWQSYTLNLE